MNKIFVLTSVLLLAAPLAAEERRAVSLADALLAADANLPALRQAQADALGAAAGADLALSPLLPQLLGTGAYQRATANFAPRPGAVSQGGTPVTVDNSIASYNYFNFGLSLNQTFFDAPTFARWRSAVATYGSQKAILQTARLDAAYQARLNFFNAQAMQSLLVVARQTLANQQRHLEQVKGFVGVGTRPEIDLAQSKTDVANAQVALIQAENNAATSKAQLNQAMGIEADTDYTLVEARADPIEFEDQGIAEQVAFAAKNRPELAAFEERIHAQALTLSASRWGWAPTLGGAVGFSDAGRDLTEMAWNWNFTVAAQWSIFSGLGTYASMRQAKAQLASLQAQRDTERIQIRLELERGRLGVRAAKATVSASVDALENAQLREKLAEGRYKAGVGSALELSDAELALTNAGAQRVQADFNVGIARATLLRALGRR